ncbi:head protein [Paenibacillus sp. FSL R7-0273]|uniref:major capsid protein n=1 Tax=Paenibacillus sp. FSL R7-0273 TaxID=1536772 RepID=UPI0004F7EE05|nr:major capsid protein [Paenibacillus sp. FSL R7-0273]AIQ45613.1 head protein [Paenibacillus sp. FSL R7-0273]OMF95131.1 major capsid protein E [Paenibacillus sp. FSL R7-0273]
MPSVLDLFSQPEILNYLGNRQYPALLGETLFPEVKRDSLEFDQIKGAGMVPVIASVHAFDTEAEIDSREGSKQAMELALIKRKRQMKEKDIIALENPRTPAEQQYLMKQVYNDVDALTAGVRARVELMRMEAASNGTVTLNENGLNLTLDYKVPANHKQVLSGSDLWSDPDSDPITQLMDWYASMGTKPKRALTSAAALAGLLRNPKVIGALFGNNSARVATRTDLNAFMTQLELPTIATYEEVYRKQKADGTYEQLRYFPQNKFVMLPADPLGETIYGPTAEEIRLARNPQIDTSKVGNVLAMVYEEGKDPVSTWTKAVATALPSFPAADEVFQATVL